MRDTVIAITAASYSGNKGAAAMLQSSITQLRERYGESLNIKLMSVYPKGDREQVPHDFVDIVSTKPEQLVFVAFPLATLYRLFKWLPPARMLLSKNKVIRAYQNTDMVVDEAGVAFVDSRGFVMNTYAFICAAVPMLVGTPVVKYSQALGSFNNPWNKFLAKWVLPKMKLICARGKTTEGLLEGIGITKNVRLCADGAFTMKDDPEAAARVAQRMRSDSFYDADVVGLSISSVVAGKCAKNGIDYPGILVDFVRHLNAQGYNVLILANAARMGSDKPRNNDLPLGDEIAARLGDSPQVRWYHEEMTAEELREYIGACRFVVASRFHTMIGALQRKVPTLLIGWSHKYQEVLDMFGLGEYATDFTSLRLEDLIDGFARLKKDEAAIRTQIDEHYDEVMESSRQNIRLISEAIDAQLAQPRPKPRALDYHDPDRYIGSYLALRKGYAVNPVDRERVASGGMITALLCNMLRNGDIDGAWVTKTKFVDGELTANGFIAQTEAEIRDAATSVYMEVPQVKTLVHDLEEFDGKIAVVLTPCMMRAFTQVLAKRPELAQKVFLKLGVFCSGCYKPSANPFFMRKAGVDTSLAERLYYRVGHWRGKSKVVYKDGTEKDFSYKKLICTYKNAYYFEQQKCTRCKDQYAFDADISFGDIWNREMKGERIKHTCCVIRSERALDVYERAVEQGVITSTHMTARDMVRGQKRALTYKWLSCTGEGRWNHKLAFRLAEANRTKSDQHPERVEKTHPKAQYYYMCFIRALLSF